MASGGVLAAAIEFIKGERERGLAQYEAEDPEFGYLRWEADGEPLTCELCLAVLVAAHHQVEKGLVELAARMTTDGRKLSAIEYRQRVDKERGELGKHDGWQRLVAKLRLAAVTDWRSVETLRKLANACKHSPGSLPDGRLLKHLELNPGVPYAPVGESRTLNQALVGALGLDSVSDIYDIAEKLVSRADRFVVAAAQAQPGLSAVEPELYSMNPGTWPR